MALSVDDLLALEDRPVQSVRVEAWGAEVSVRVMTGMERDQLAALHDGPKKPSVVELRRALFSRGLCDADGKRLPPAVIEKVMAKSGVALEQLSQALSDLNGLNPEAREKLLGKPDANSEGATASSG